MDSSCPAFVIVDSFPSALASVFSPKSHWQLCGATIFEHTLNWLDRSNVDCAYIWCCNAESFRYVPPALKKVNCSFRTEVIESEKVIDFDDDEEVSKSCATLGDCMRYADTSDLLAKYAAASSNDGHNRGRSALPDFLLLGGNTFAQQPLSASLKRHRQWKEKDRSCVLTVVCSANCVQPADSGLCLATDVNGRLLHWRDSVGESQDLTVPPSLVAPKSSSGGELLVWPRIYPIAAVCSPEVLVQFADNFDYENIADVIRGLLTNEEVLGQHIYIDVIDSDMKGKNGKSQNTVFHVTDLMSFAYTTRSLLLSATLSRSPFSLSHLVSPAYYHRFPSSFVSSVASPGLSIIEGISFVSSGASFTGSPSSVSSSYIGPNSIIGGSCFVEESYIGDNVRVDDGVSICFSFISSNCLIKSNSTVGRGCIIAPSVVIGTGARIPANTFIFNATQGSMYSTELLRGTPLKLQAPSSDVIGIGASECFAISINDLPRPVQYFLKWPGLLRQVKTKVISSTTGRSRTVSGMEQISQKSFGDKDAESVLDEPNRNSLDSEQTIKRRDIELDEAIDRTIREKLSADNAILEVNSIKHAYGVGIRELTTTVIRAIVTVPLRSNSPITNANLLTHVNSVLSNVHVLPLAKHYVRSSDARIDCLTAVETVAATSQPYLVNMSGLLQQLYSTYDLVDDDSVKKWFAAVPNQSPVKKAAQPFVQWLESAEEESDDGDDED